MVRQSVSFFRTKKFKIMSSIFGILGTIAAVCSIGYDLYHGAIEKAERIVILESTVNSLDRRITYLESKVYRISITDSLTKSKKRK